LADKTQDLIEAANDFHYAMINDVERNEFFRASLERVIDEDSVVLEIGTGSGLLAMIAARLGARHVVAIEASQHMCEVAWGNILANGLSDRITLINKLSTQVSEDDLPFGKATILVSEILGTLLLGESALDYVADARERLLTKDAAIIPLTGAQYATLIESADIASITSVSGWGGIDLSRFNSLQDTVSCVFTKQYGFRFSSVPSRVMADRVSVADVDFASDAPGFIPDERTIRIRALHTGVVHAILLTWEAFGDPEKDLCISTEPEKTRGNFPRDMQWGQALQLIEDEDTDGEGPVPLRVEEGEELDLVVRCSSDSVLFQFSVRRVPRK
jgi:protein arginine N-methyltransferase 7